MVSKWHIFTQKISSLQNPLIFSTGSPIILQGFPSPKPLLHHQFIDIHRPLRSLIMDLRFLLPSPLSYPTSALRFPLPKSPFLGPIFISPLPSLRLPRRHLPLPILAAAAVKRRKELPFDNVIQRDKKLKLVLKIRSILVAQPDRTMNLRDLGRFRRDLGLTRKRRFIALLKRFPAVFEIVEEGVYSLKFRLTPAAERLYLDELSLRTSSEDAVVLKLRKLLMMSLDKRILISKLAHLKTDFGLPLEFRATICDRYPQYFRVVPTDGGPALELTYWDPALAVTAAETAEQENRAREMSERNLIIDRPPKFNRVKLPRGLNLSKGEMRRITQFRDMPFISPYSDFSMLSAGTPQKEKHACAVVHEMLSMTMEKRTLVDHLTHFRDEFRFSQQLRGMLIRHPDMFYVSLKGDRDSVFLREAYRDSQLVEKDKMLLLKEKMRALVAVPRSKNRPPGMGGVGGVLEGGNGLEGDEEYGDDLGSEFDDEDGFGDDGEDDWSDEEDAIVEAMEDSKITTLEGDNSLMSSTSRMDDDEVRVPVLPDGTPRERW